MSQSTELVRALLPEFCQSDADAEAILAAAEALAVDPLDYCIHRYGLDPEEIVARGARWAGLAFSLVAASTSVGDADIKRIDDLADARSIRTPIWDRHITYVAPRFNQLVAFKDYVAANPEIRRTTCVAPASAIRRALAKHAEPQLVDEARQRVSRRWPFASAHLDLGKRARLTFLSVAILLVLLAALAPQLLKTVILPFVGLVLLIPALFRLLAVIAYSNRQAPPPLPLDDRDLPIYSVLIPLRDEAEMVPLLKRAMSALSYPPEKLDIKFVVEQQSAATVAAVETLLGDPRFELLVVPPVAPFTKPKAINYALPLVRGAYVVVYDAEDIPNPDQLRLAAAAFGSDPGVDCLQAELLIDNARENTLTALFTGEYAGQFGMVLPALARWGLPMPLGGTSNHFRTSALRQLGGWDAFNVTEDADLGVRLARLRYRTTMLPSQTYEEAPISIPVWMRQRTRWMKGWMQTFIVHNHQPLALLRDMGWKGFLAFEIYVGSMILSPLLHTAFLASLLLRLLIGDGPPFTSGDPQALVALGVLVIGYGGSFALVVAGLLRLGQRRLLAYQLLLPLYWVLHTVATVRAGYELVTRPHFWAKTTHGLTRLQRSFEEAQVSEDRETDGEAYEPASER